MDAVLVRPLSPADQSAVTALFASAGRRASSAVSPHDCCVAMVAGPPERIIGFAAWWHVRLDKFRMDLLVAPDSRRPGVAGVRRSAWLHRDDAHAPAGSPRGLGQTDAPRAPCGPAGRAWSRARDAGARAGAWGSLLGGVLPALQCCPRGLARPRPGASHAADTIGVAAPAPGGHTGAWGRLRTMLPGRARRPLRRVHWIAGHRSGSCVPRPGNRHGPQATSHHLRA